jgi:hypothetical protein
MRSSATRRLISIAPVAWLLTALGSVMAGEGSSSDIPLPPEITSQRIEVHEGKSLKSAGIAVYVAGALYDLYTTKRAMDAGLQESNPLLSRSSDPNRTLAAAAVAKVGIAIVIGKAGRRGGDRARGAWFLSCGIIQLGAGFLNRRATIQERDSYATGQTVGVVAPAPGPFPKGGEAAFTPAFDWSGRKAAPLRTGITTLKADGVSPSAGWFYRVRK